jgi:spore coat protein U-like protein
LEQISIRCVSNGSVNPAITAGPIEEAARTQRLRAPSATRATVTQKVSMYKTVSPAPTQASPRFGDQNSESRVHATYAAKRLLATTLHGDLAFDNMPPAEITSRSVAKKNTTKAHSPTK